MSTASRLIEVEGLPSTVPYAYASTTVPGARLVHLAGACPLDGEGRVVARDDVRAQARACVETMRVALAAAGASPADVVLLRVLVASAARSDLADAWDVVHAAFDGHEPPGTLMGVTVLGWEHQLVEVEAVAAVLD